MSTGPIDPLDHLGLVREIALEYLPVAGSFEFSDLFQEGSIGLMRAARGFDPGRGCKFSTYAYPWIRASIRRALANTRDLIRIPCHLHPATCPRAARTRPFFAHARGVLRAQRRRGRYGPLAASGPAGGGDGAPEAAEALLGRLARVNPRGAEILRLHYGIGADAPLPFREIARRYGVRRQAIEQGEERALRRLAELAGARP